MTEAMNGSKDESAIIVLHRRQRVKVQLGKTVGEVLQVIENETGLPANEQSLILLGKKVNLQDLQASPQSVGLINGAITMLMRGRPSSLTVAKKVAIDNSSIPELTHIREADGLVTEVRRELGETDESVSRHTKGFLNVTETEEALHRDDLKARGLDERLMTLLEKLDGLDPPQRDDDELAKRMEAQWRAERKGVINRVQTTLKDIDGLRGRIDQLRKDVYGDVDRRRGKQ